MKKVLVTGAYGFLGRHVAKVFSENKWNVLGIGHGNWAEREWKSWGLSEWHSTDINCNALMTYAGESEIIIHCAGSANVSFSMKHPRQDFERSVKTTLDVLEYARLQSPATAVVFPSSAAVYGKALSLPTKDDRRTANQQLRAALPGARLYHPFFLTLWGWPEKTDPLGCL